jgi:hypothetical protein
MEQLVLILGIVSAIITIGTFLFQMYEWFKKE